jgi:hypothetical protein
MSQPVTKKTVAEKRADREARGTQKVPMQRIKETLTKQERAAIEKDQQYNNLANDPSFKKIKKTKINDDNNDDDKFCGNRFLTLKKK